MILTCILVPLTALLAGLTGWYIGRWDLESRRLSAAPDTVDDLVVYDDDPKWPEGPSSLVQ